MFEALIQPLAAAAPPLGAVCAILFWLLREKDRALLKYIADRDASMVKTQEAHAIEREAAWRAVGALGKDIRAGVEKLGDDLREGNQETNLRLERLLTLQERGHR